MTVLEQPNGRADEPWPVDGLFHDTTHGYLALGEHHTTGDFAPLIAQFVDGENAVEITEEEYYAAVNENYEL